MGETVSLLDFIEEKFKATNAKIEALEKKIDKQAKDFQDFQLQQENKKTTYLAAVIASVTAFIASMLALFTKQ